MVRGRVSEEHLLLRGCCPWHRGSVLPVLRFPAFPLKPAGLPCALCHYISQSGLCRKEAPSKWLLAPWKILDSPKFCLWRFIITATEQISTGAWFFCYSFKNTSGFQLLVLQWRNTSQWVLYVSELSPHMQDEGFRVTVKGPNSAYEPTWQRCTF